VHTFDEDGLEIPIRASSQCFSYQFTLDWSFKCRSRAAKEICENKMGLIKILPLSLSTNQELSQTTRSGH